MHKQPVIKAVLCLGVLLGSGACMNDPLETTDQGPDGSAADSVASDRAAVAADVAADVGPVDALLSATPSDALSAVVVADAQVAADAADVLAGVGGIDSTNNR